MRENKFVSQHSFFLVLLSLFLLIGAVDLLNIDRILYKSLCSLVSPLTGYPCADFYDLPIWEVYFTAAIVAALYHVHEGIKTSNKHLLSLKK